MENCHLTKDKLCDTLDRYEAESIREALTLYVSGADDPQPERRADLRTAFVRLCLQDRWALYLTAIGCNPTEIARAIRGSSDTRVGKRMYERGFANLQSKINGSANGGVK